jgi:xanthine dehydrogenase accessory factor
MYIFGGGHISFSLARIGKMTGFRVVVIDDREEYANPERFPEADETIAEGFPQVFSRIAVNNFSYIVIVTRGHAYDQAVLEWALTTEAYYIGMIGSRKKTKQLFGNLKAQGVSEEALGQVYTPIGLDIKAETPEEIAVSIMAEIIKIRRSGENERKATCPA